MGDNGHFLEPSTTTERVALSVYRIMEGAQPTTREVATMSGVTWQAADRMLDNASRVVPIVKDRGRWRRF